MRASLLLHAVADTWAWQVICRLVCRQEGEEKRSGPGPAALADTRARRGLKPGQLDPQTADFAHRLRELAGRRSYLRNFWYAAGARPAPAGAALRCALGPLTWRSTLCLARLLGGRPPMQRAAREALSWRRCVNVLKTLYHNLILETYAKKRARAQASRRRWAPSLWAWRCWARSWCSSAAATAPCTACTVRGRSFSVSYGAAGQCMRVLSFVCTPCLTGK